ncbi:hypothetical protein AA3271_1055 [Gluconobacter japonicus NBRC 3271]|nr:hypothetical protein AA3271_1055 [Gluconobacter japonicus NBRC 3271]
MVFNQTIQMHALGSNPENRNGTSIYLTNDNAKIVPDVKRLVMGGVHTLLGQCPGKREKLLSRRNSEACLVFQA